MNRNYFKQPDGYRETIERGIAGVQRFRGGLTEGNLSREEAIQKLKTEINAADAVVIGAGAGLSTSAGFIYNGERSTDTFLILRSVSVFRICTLADFTPIRT